MKQSIGEVTANNLILGHSLQVAGGDKSRTLNKRPRLLFLACHFPPVRAPACARTWSVAKYLTRLGWDVTVIAPDPSLWRYVDNSEETDANLKRQGIGHILTGHRWRCLAPSRLKCWDPGFGWFVGGVCRKIARCLDVNNGIGWVKAAEEACSILTAQDVDIILATGPPFAAFRLAKRLSDRLGRPYVLDYRDPWAGNPHAVRPPRRATIQEEARLLSDCAAVTIVSRSWGLAIDHRFGLGPKLHVVTNGYDPEALADVQPNDFGHFAIVYTGNFYPPKRLISPVMAALKRLKETINGKSSEWYFHYYGGHEKHVREEAARLGVTKQVILHGRVPRNEALSAVRGAGVAVVITSIAEEATIEEKGIMTGKVFEALGLGTPVLLVAPSGSDTEAVAETTGLVRSFTGSDTHGMASFLAAAVYGRVPEPKHLDAYAWPHLAKKLDAVLRRAALGATRNRCEANFDYLDG